MSMDQKSGYFKMLQSRPTLAIEKGDTVSVAIGLLGHGYDWVRQECTVLDVQSTSAQIEWPKDVSMAKITGESKYTEWVDRKLITDVIKKAEQPKKMVKKSASYWANIYPNGDFTFYPTKIVADSYALSTRIACVHLTGEYEVTE